MLRVAYEAACKALPAHQHRFSPRKFTQPQLLACLVLKEFSRLDYRGLAAHLVDHPDLGTQIGIKAAPHFTTFQKAAQRLLTATPGRRMFDAVIAGNAIHELLSTSLPLIFGFKPGLSAKPVSVSKVGGILLYNGGG